MVRTERVSLSVGEAANQIKHGVVNGSISGTLVDMYHQEQDQGRSLIVLVFEKYFARNSSRASVTVTIENLSGQTIVHAVGSGGGQGVFFKFDWGASSSFQDQVFRAIEGSIL